MKKDNIKISLLLQTFIIFFTLFLIRNYEYYKIDIEIESKLTLLMNITVYVFSLLAIIGVIGLIKMAYSFRGTKDLPVNVCNIEEYKENSLIFFVTYILPLITIDINNMRNYWCFNIILSIIFILCYKTNLWYCNPILSILNYKTYKVSTKSKSFIAISKDYIKVDDAIEILEISEDVMYVRKKVKHE